MKAIYSRMSPRLLMTLVVITEVLMGASYIGIVVMQTYNHPLCLPFQYAFQLLHTCALVAGLSLALMRAGEKHFLSGLPRFALLLAALFVKDFLGNFYSFWYADGYLAGDAMILSLSTTALSTLVITGLASLTSYLLAYLFFLYMRPAAEAPQSVWEIGKNHLLRAVLFTTVAVVLPTFIQTIVNQFDFLIHDALWMPSGSEILTLALELIFIPLFAALAYFNFAYFLRHTPRKENTENPQTIKE